MMGGRGEKMVRVMAAAEGEGVIAKVKKKTRKMLIPRTKIILLIITILLLLSL